LADWDAGTACAQTPPDCSNAAILTTAFFESLVKYVVTRLRLQVGTVAIDGTVIESAASRFHLLKVEAAQEAARAAAHAHPEAPSLQAQARAAAERAEVATTRAGARAAQGREAAQTAVARSDPAAVLQPRKDGAWRPGYKPSILVHESGGIVGHTVHASNEVAQVGALLAQHAAVFGAPPTTALLDGNYHCAEVLGPCVAQDMDVRCASGGTQRESWNKRGARGRFAKSAFVYEAGRDRYRCPAGHELLRQGHGTNRHGHAYTRYRTPACRGCAVRAQCPTATQGRVIDRFEGDEYKELMRTVMEHPAARKKYRQRAAIAERPYAEVTERQRLRRFHRRGLLGVRVEFALHCMAFDLKAVLRTALRGPLFVLPWPLPRLWSVVRHRVFPQRAIGAQLAPQLA
jgi:hypothetical protein